MIEVTQDDENRFTIYWDENDPTEKVFNDYTEEDFINLIQNYLNTLQESGEVDINQVTEAVNQINDHIEEEIIATCEETFGKECYEKDTTLYEFIDQTSIEVFEDIQNAEDFLATRDQDTEQSQDRTLPPPDNFPLFP
ncbi:hypothetical protein BOW91_gp191 [Synechococcus phage S-WAM2]|uniref:Uncharacterized protein n=1 Tax=Synechococcus phage S-WAM2 TaxID=1815522 RepID=A0A1D8KSX6_9CAUD|nr:hypothetical protein BOW91_gp191 [Synechococcus phage S-WAM2]AOV61755.1 hypothetical protein P29B0810_060 [Synechococcus phage S-WAM2]